MIRFSKKYKDPLAHFALTFDNGYTISIVGGKGAYSTGDLVKGFMSVEVGAWDINGDWFPLREDDDVIGFRSAEEVADIIEKIRNLPAKEKAA